MGLSRLAKRAIGVQVGHSRQHTFIPAPAPNPLSRLPHPPPSPPLSLSLSLALPLSVLPPPHLSPYASRLGPSHTCSISPPSWLVLPLPLRC